MLDIIWMKVRIPDESVVYFCSSSVCLKTSKLFDDTLTKPVVGSTLVCYLTELLTL